MSILYRFLTLVFISLFVVSSANADRIGILGEDNNTSSTYAYSIIFPDNSWSVSGGVGTLSISGGGDLSASDIDTAAKLETVANLGAYASDILGAADSDALVTLLELAAGDIPDISGTYEVQLNNEAGLYAVLSDVTKFYEAGDEDTIAAAITSLPPLFDTLADFTNDINAQDRFTQDVTAVIFTGSDATPDVTNGGSTVVQFWRSVDTTTITDFDDGDDHSEFGDGDAFVLIFNSAQVIDCSGNANIKGHGNNDYTGAAGEWALVIWDATNNYWIFKPSETKVANFTTLRIPNSDDPDVANAGEISLDTDGWVRIYQNSLQKGIPVDFDEQFTVVQPDDMDEADLLTLWCNNSGMALNIHTINAKADVDNTAFTLKEAGGTDYTSLSTIEAITVATDGTSIYYYTIGAGAGTGIDDSSIANGNCIVYDAGATDVKHVWLEIQGYYGADVN